MISTCECVSLGHPDRTADAITSYILDKYLEKDPNTRYAVECQIKDQFVTLGGEITSNAGYSHDQICGFVKDAVRRIGYTSEYASNWPACATLNADKIQCTINISRQSPDIAQGVNRQGWGDQGVFAGMAVNKKSQDYMPLDRYYSHKICDTLYKCALSGEIEIGLDIKTQVTMDENFVCEVIVAAPVKPGENTMLIKKRITDKICNIIPVGCGPDSIIFNGTGSYVIHSSYGDCGTTGRKLAVDFYGLNCPIGGGAPWSKDGTKADVALNLYARYLAKAYAKNFNLPIVFTKLSCCIGKPDVTCIYFDDKGNQVDGFSTQILPKELINLLQLNKPIYFDMCKNGLFFKADKVAEDLIFSSIEELIKMKLFEQLTHTKKRNEEMKQEKVLAFKPIVTKKEAQKNLTAALVVCKERKGSFVSITKLNACFGMKGKGGETANKAVKLLGLTPVVKGKSRFLTKEDARKVIDFVYANKAK